MRVKLFFQSHEILQWWRQLQLANYYRDWPLYKNPSPCCLKLVSTALVGKDVLHFLKVTPSYEENVKCGSSKLANWCPNLVTTILADMELYNFLKVTWFFREDTISASLISLKGGKLNNCCHGAVLFFFRKSDLTNVVNPFPVTGVFLYSINTENQRFSDIFRECRKRPVTKRFSDVFKGYRKRPEAWNWLKIVKIVLSQSAGRSLSCCLNLIIIALLDAENWNLFICYKLCKICQIKLF